MVDDLLNSDLTDFNLSIEGMENWNLDDSNQVIDSIHYELDDSGGGGGTETAYGTCAFCDFDIVEKTNPLNEGEYTEQHS